MQIQMGSHGILRDFKPPYQNYTMNRYAIILNMVPALHRELVGQHVSDSVAYDYAKILQESLIRHIGNIEDLQKVHHRQLKNPVIWLREGVRSIITFPAMLLGWLGVISEFTVNKIISSFFMKAVSSFVFIVGFISGIMTIVLGWEPFFKKIKYLFF